MQQLSYRISNVLNTNFNYNNVKLYQSYMSFFVVLVSFLAFFFFFNKSFGLSRVFIVSFAYLRNDPIQWLYIYANRFINDVAQLNISREIKIQQLLKWCSKTLDRKSINSSVMLLVCWKRANINSTALQIFAQTFCMVFVCFFSTLNCIRQWLILICWCVITMCSFRVQ